MKNLQNEIVLIKTRVESLSSEVKRISSILTAIMQLCDPICKHTIDHKSLGLKTKDSNENLPEHATNPVNSTGSAICVEAQLHEQPLTNKSPIKLQSVEQAIDDKTSGRKGSSLLPNNKQTNKQINEISAAIEIARVLSDSKSENQQSVKDRANGSTIVTHAVDEIDTNQITIDPEISPADDISFQFGSSEESTSQNSISYSQAIKTNKSETLSGVKPR